MMGDYFDAVALTAVLLRGDTRRVERLDWLLDAVEAERIPLAVVSNKKRGKPFMVFLIRANGCPSDLASGKREKRKRDKCWEA